MFLIFCACHCFSGLEADSINLSIFLTSTSGIVSKQSGIVMVCVQNLFSLNLSRSLHEKCLGDLNFSSCIVHEECCWIIQCFRIGFFSSLIQSLFKVCKLTNLVMLVSYGYPFRPRARVFLVIFKCERES